MSALHTCLHVHHVHAPCQQRSEEAMGFPGTTWMFRIGPDTLQEQEVPVT